MTMTNGFFTPTSGVENIHHIHRSTGRARWETPEVKKIILDLSNEGYSGHRISQVGGVIPRTVSKFLKRVRERGNEENFSRPGIQRKTNIRGDRKLFWVVRENRRQTLEDLTNKFNNTSVDNLSSRPCRTLFLCIQGINVHCIDAKHNFSCLPLSQL
jgi:hypothetical protein